MDFGFFTFIYYIVYFVAMIFIIFKANAYDGIWSFIFAPITVYRIVFGKGRYILIPVAFSFLSAFLPGLFIAAIIWHIIFSVALGKAYDAPIWLILFLIILPGISLIVLAFSKYDYTGPVGLLFFLRRG